MKTKLLAVGVIVLDFLIVVYVVEMKFGWQGVLRMLGALGGTIGILFAVLITVWALSTLMDDGSSGEF